LADAWRDAKEHLPLLTYVDGERFGAPEAGEDMTFDFAPLLEHITKRRRAGAGTILGLGTVSHNDRSRGSTRIAARRALETVEYGKPLTPFLRFGDRVRIEMLDKQGRSVFGAIDQRVVRAAR
jgi:fumarylacetoacetate (FAA) hydrolase